MEPKDKGNMARAIKVMGKVRAKVADTDPQARRMGRDLIITRQTISGRHGKRLLQLQKRRLEW